MIPRSLKRLLGFLPQEYICVAREDLDNTPKVLLTQKGSRDAIDVTQTHWLLGYKPLIIAVAVPDQVAVENEICLSFGDGPAPNDGQWRGFVTTRTAIGRLELRKLDHELPVPGIRLYAGAYGQHDFLKGYQVAANILREALSRKKPSDANLSGNLYEQVRIAYAVPRPISVITVKDRDLLNFFPTDLHGRLSDRYYISSLRIGGMACNQVESLRRLVISTVDVAAFRSAYGLGSNHMQPPRPPASFEPTLAKSSSGIPVYPHATSYLDLELVQSWDYGIHRMFLYNIAGGEQISNGKTLAHIHRYYAQWRINRGRSGEYFFR